MLSQQSWIFFKSWLGFSKNNDEPLPLPQPEMGRASAKKERCLTDM
jgi:hypothetical protein